jgi:archaemetzincin
LPSPESGDKILGVVDVDVFAPELNFVFGQAYVTVRKAIISLQRLKQEFYSLLKNENVFQARIFKEAVQELGHTYGHEHCFNLTCVMPFSTSKGRGYRGWGFRIPAYAGMTYGV